MTQITDNAIEAAAQALREHQMRAIRLAASANCDPQTIIALCDALEEARAVPAPKKT